MKPVAQSHRAPLKGLPPGRSLWILAGLLALLASLHSQATNAPAIPPAAELSTVLEVRRMPDVDVVFLRDGSRRTGVLANDVFHLRTAHGTLNIPARHIAAIELADGRRELDSVITVNRNRLSGFLEDNEFVLPSGEADARGEIRREKAVKCVFRRRPDELKGLSQGALVLLRNGDFFTGRLASDRFEIEDTRAALRWTPERVASVTFPHAGEGAARLALANGETVMALAPGEDLEFDLDLGLRIKIYRGRIEEIFANGNLPAALLRRIGADSVADQTGAVASFLPDQGVSPGEGMVWIPPGEFLMNSSTTEKDRDLDEGPQTRVVLPVGFWIGRCEVSQTEYEAVMGNNPSHHLGDGRHPVEKVTWQEAVDYCRKRTEREREAGRLPADYAFRLPTEAEWEYACRAGTSTRFSFGDDPRNTLAGDYAWFGSNSESATHPVGMKKPNPWGLYDMHGNVWEWCLDRWSSALPGGAVTNRVATLEGTLRVARGGSWLYEARFCRSANRDCYGMLNRCSDVGFRVVLVRIPGDAKSP